MHIFQNLKTPDKFRIEQDKAIAKKRGLSLEEYRAQKKKEQEEERKIMHNEELKSLGITEEEFQTKDRNRIRKRKYIDYAWGLFSIICVPMVLFLLYYGMPEFLKSSGIGKEVLLIVGVIFVVVIVVFYLCAPVFMAFWSFLGGGKGNRLLKVVIALIITLLVVGLILSAFGYIGNGEVDIYEPGKLRPNKF
jgi:cation transport ATPase